MDAPMVTDSFGGKDKFARQLEQSSMGLREQQGERSSGQDGFDLQIIKHFPITFLKDVYYDTQRLILFYSPIVGPFDGFQYLVS